MVVIKRDGRKVEFDSERIVMAIQKAIVDVEHLVEEAADEADYPFIIANFIEEEFAGNEVEVETIQDKVELLLMDFEPIVAKAYILYRYQQSTERKEPVRDRLLTDDFISKYKKMNPPMGELGNFVYYRTYSRWLPEEKRREYWWETVRRAVEFNASLAPTTKDEAEKLFDNIFHLKQFLSGRTLFTGGTKVSKRYGLSNFNCSYTIADEFESFKDLFYLLLIGAGVGLGIRKADVAKLPKVKGNIKLINKAYTPKKKDERIEYTALQFEDNFVEIIVGDSKEAWCQALEYFFKMYFDNGFSKVDTIIMNYDNIRSEGERLKTFGGFASGHAPLMNMFDKIHHVLVKDNEISKKLKPIDCLDIANIIGISVVSGGVRRTSEVMLFDADDEEVKNCKSNLYKQIDGEWQIDEKIAHRRMSNNSIQYEQKPSREEWHEHIKAMRFSGEPAFQNLEAAKKRRADAQGGNPCMEIILRKNGVCNLTELNAMGFVEDGQLNEPELYEAQKLSAKAGYRMATIDFELHKWDLVNKEDMLIGCGLTGWYDMVNATGISEEKQIELLKNLKQIAHKAANELAEKLQLNKPKLYTTIKPSGTLSQLPGVSSGVHYSHSPYYLRRVRINAFDPLVGVVRELGYPVLPEVGQTEENCDTVVVEFPIKAPQGKTKYEVSAIEQLENYLLFMKYYADHNVSITVHVRDYEWDDVEQWCWDNWDETIAISFLSLDDSFYQLMPYESIEEEDYKERKAKMKKFNPTLLKKYEKEEVELDIGDDGCESGVCPIR